MSPMRPRASARKTYRRAFAWMFVLATIIGLGLVWAALAFPPAQLFLAQSTPAMPGDFDREDLNILTALAASLALIALVGLFVTMPVTWRERRKERRQARVEAALRLSEDRARRARMAALGGKVEPLGRETF